MNIPDMYVQVTIYIKNFWITWQRCGPKKRMWCTETWYYTIHQRKWLEIPKKKLPNKKRRTVMCAAEEYNVA